MPNILVNSFQSIWNKFTFNKTENSQESSSVDNHKEQNITKQKIEAAQEEEKVANNGYDSQEQNITKQKIEAAQEEDKVANNGYDSQEQNIINQLLEAAQEEKVTNDSQEQNITKQKIEAALEDDFDMLEELSEYRNNKGMFNKLGI